MAPGRCEVRPRAREARLEVCELFESIAGESSLAGLPAVFVRLAGCNLDCAWCDTRYALEPGTRVAVDELAELVLGRRPGLVVVTGGEPLNQQATPALCEALLAGGKRVQVETNGSLSTAGLPGGVQVVLDMKPPSSGMSDRMARENLRRLRPGDDLKIVVADRTDFDWAAALIREAGLDEKVGVLLSPAAGHLEPGLLATWLLDANLPARLQIQLHRLLWPDGGEGVPIPIRPNP